MRPDLRRRLGRTGIEVTALGLGTAPIGGFRGPTDDAEAQDTLHAALSAGIRYFDTAPLYGYGGAELRMGAVLRGLPRDSFVLSTKVGRTIQPIRPGADLSRLLQGGLPGFHAVFDYSYDGAMRALEQSFCRLGIPEIDILLIHDVDPAVHGGREAADRRFAEAMDGCYRALVELRRGGQVRAIGTGINDPAMTARFLRAGDFDCALVAGKYTLLEHQALDELLPLCAEKGVGVMLGMPLETGLLAKGPVPGATYKARPAPAWALERTARLAEVCGRHGVPLPAAALQFPLAHPQVATTIPGTRSRRSLAQIVAWMETPIPAELWAELRQEGLLDERAPVP